MHDLSRLRHVSITRQDDATGTPADRADDDGDARSPPAWFVALVHPEQTSVSVPVSINGKPGSLVITSHPDDEMAEIWDGIVTQLEVGSAIAIALFLITMTVVGRALAPLQALVAGDDAGSRPGTMTRVSNPAARPNWPRSVRKLNHLAATLGDAVEDKRRLAERAVSLQDVERKEIARELHDEFGPYLFALRAHAGALMRLAEAPEPDRKRCASMAARSWSRSMRCSSSTAGFWRSFGRSGLAELGLARGAGRLAASVGRIPSRRGHRDQHFATRSARPARPPI